MTRHRSGISAARAAAAAVGTVLAIGTLSACGSETKAVNIAAIPVAATAVESVTFTASGRAAQLRAVDGLWTPASGATVQAATMLTASGDRFFPLNSYRIMEGLNQSDPAFGLSGQESPVKECRPECSMTVVDTGGKTWKLTIGAQTFNGGFYAKLDGDPRVFLITKDTVAGIISEAIGKDFAFPASQAIRNVERQLQGENEQGEKKAELPDYDPFLRQVMAAEETEACIKAKKENCDEALVEAAGSTQDQPGAKKGKDVRANSEALKQPTGATQ